MQNRKVIIIGAGIGGFVTALELRKKYGDAIRIKMYEQRKGIEHIGGALGIWPNGSKVLLNLPCAKQIEKLDAKHRYEIWGNMKGEVLRVVDRKEFEKMNGYPSMIICRSELLKILMETWGEHNIVFNKKVTGLQHHEKKTEIFFEDGSSDIADLVIDASGIYSKIRQAIFPDCELSYTGYISLVGIFRTPDTPHKNVIYGQNQLFLIFPISGERYMIYATRRIEQGYLKQYLQTRDEQINAFRGTSNEANEVLDALQESLNDPELAQHYHCAEVNDMRVMPPSYHHKRVAFVGDAIRAIGPTLGFNANLTAEDAKVLVDCLYSEDDIDKALRQYSSYRINATKPFITLEENRRNFIVYAKPKDYLEFEDKVKNSLPYEFLQPFFAAMRTASYFQPVSLAAKIKKVSEICASGNEAYVNSEPQQDFIMSKL